MRRSVSHAGRLVGAAGARHGLDRVAGVEQHRAALLHVGVDARQRRGRRLRARPARSASRSAGRTPVRRARCRGRPDRRPPARCAGPGTASGLQPGAADVVDLGVAGDHIGEPGLLRRLQREFKLLRVSARGCPAAIAAGRWQEPAWVAARSSAASDRRRGRRAAAGARSKRHAAGQEEHDQRVEREQPQRGQSAPARAGPAARRSGTAARRAPSGAKSSASSRSSRASVLTASEPVRRAVEAGRMVGAGAAGAFRRRPAAPSPAAGRRRRSRRARGSAGPVRALALVAVGLGRRRRGRRPGRRSRRSISTKAPDSGRSDQRVSAVTWNSTTMPLPALVGGDERRAVGERRPGAVGQAGLGLGQHLALTRDVGRARACRRTGLRGEKAASCCG